MTTETNRLSGPDPRDGEVYVMSEDLDLAIDVAHATRRPLLLRGEPGSGKSSLAPYVARLRNWRYYEHVITSRTQTTDLLWSFDAVRRLADAQRHERNELDDFRYVQPGVLWWAMAPTSAARRGAEPDTPSPLTAVDPFAEINHGRSQDHAVVLIDEIDKADPDVPNSLLVPLGSTQFVVAETNTIVRPEPPTAAGAEQGARLLVIITTNEERELPQALLRRCVVVTLPPPSPQRLVAIAGEHIGRVHGAFQDSHRRLAVALAQELHIARQEATDRALRAPSTAEYLDAIHACLDLNIEVGSERWARLRSFLLIKSQQPD